MQAAVAAGPIAVVLVAMVGLRWSAARAGLAGVAVAAALAVGAFGFGGPGDPFGVVEGSVGVAAEAGFIAFTIVLILGPALGVHHLQQRTGASDRLRAALGRLSPDPRVAGLLVAWFFALFLEGAAGFGTPVALAAPFLVAIGFSPLAAVTAALIGHASGVSFGAVGTPVMAMAASSGIPGPVLAAATAPYHVALGWILAAALVVTIGRATGGPPPWAAGAAATTAFFVPYWLLARFVGPELPTLGGALVASAVFVAVFLRPRPGPPVGAGERIAPGDVARAAAPYLALVALVGVTRLVPPVRDALQAVVVRWELFDRFHGEIQPLHHPGVLLAVAFVVGAIAQGAPGHEVARVFADTNRQLVPVTVALVAMVGIARFMTSAGMTDELAAAAAGAGTLWPVLAPAVGALGSFVTGSATASNVLFTGLQQSTAQALGQPVEPLLGAQGFGAAVGNIICPHNIVAAAATVGLTGREAPVLRRTLPLTLGTLLAGGLLALWFVR
jgi:lactate permease